MLVWVPQAPRASRPYLSAYKQTPAVRRCKLSTILGVGLLVAIGLALFVLLNPLTSSHRAEQKGRLMAMEYTASTFDPCMANISLDTTAQGPRFEFPIIPDVVSFHGLVKSSLAIADIPVVPKVASTRPLSHESYALVHIADTQPACRPWEKPVAIEMGAVIPLISFGFVEEIVAAMPAQWPTCGIEMESAQKYLGKAVYAIGVVGSITFVCVVAAARILLAVLGLVGWSVLLVLKALQP